MLLKNILYILLLNNISDGRIFKVAGLKKNVDNTIFKLNTLRDRVFAEKYKHAHSNKYYNVKTKLETINTIRRKLNERPYAVKDSAPTIGAAERLRRKKKKYMQRTRKGDSLLGNVVDKDLAEFGYRFDDNTLITTLRTNTENYKYIIESNIPIKRKDNKNKSLNTSYVMNFEKASIYRRDNFHFHDGNRNPHHVTHNGTTFKQTPLTFKTIELTERGILLPLPNIKTHGPSTDNWLKVSPKHITKRLGLSETTKTQKTNFKGHSPRARSELKEATLQNEITASNANLSSNTTATVPVAVDDIKTSPGEVLGSETLPEFKELFKVTTPLNPMTTTLPLNHLFLVKNETNVVIEDMFEVITASPITLNLSNTTLSTVNKTSISNDTIELPSASGITGVFAVSHDPSSTTGPIRNETGATNLTSVITPAYGITDIFVVSSASPNRPQHITNETGSTDTTDLLPVHGITGVFIVSPEIPNTTASNTDPINSVTPVIENITNPSPHNTTQFTNETGSIVTNPTLTETQMDLFQKLSMNTEVDYDMKTNAISLTMPTTTEATTTKKPSDGQNFFSQFLLELFRIIATKDPQHLKLLVPATYDRLLIIGEGMQWTHQLGYNLHKSIRDFAHYIYYAPTDLLQGQAKLLYQQMLHRQQYVSRDVNAVIDYYNKVLTDDEEDKLISSIEDLEEFPNGSKNADVVVKEFVRNLIINPFEMNYNLDTTILADNLNKIVGDRFNPPPQMVPINKRRFNNEVNVGRSSDVDESDNTQARKKPKNKLVYGVRSLETLEVTLGHNNIPLKRKQNKEIKSKHRPKINKKKQTIRLKHNENNRHPQIYHKYIKHKLTTRQLQNSYYNYEKYLNEYKNIRKKYAYPNENSNNKLHNQYAIYGTKLFNTAATNSIEYEIRTKINDKNVIRLNEEIFSTINMKDKNKINPNVKQKSFSKFAINSNKNNNVAPIATLTKESINSEESILINNLHDALIYENINRSRRIMDFKQKVNSINALSSYSDEEIILKNNIYEIFNRDDTGIEKRAGNIIQLENNITNNIDKASFLSYSEEGRLLVSNFDKAVRNT